MSTNLQFLARKPPMQCPAASKTGYSAAKMVVGRIAAPMAYVQV
jgi:hypothetical protein